MSAVANPTSVSVAFGSVNVLFFVCEHLSVVDVFAEPDAINLIILFIVFAKTQFESNIVFLLKISLVDSPTKTSVVVGNVIVPLFMMVEIVGNINVLLVNVSVVSRPTKLVFICGKVRVAPLFKMLFITGEINVLLFKVSVVVLPINVSVDVGKVRVPPLIIVEITGETNVLLLSVSVEFAVINISEELGKDNNIPLALFLIAVNTGVLKKVFSPANICDPVETIPLED